METVIMHPKTDEQLSALKAFAKALKMDFETTQNSYNPDFVKKIKQSKKQAEKGNFITLDPDKSLWENLG